MITVDQAKNIVEEHFRGAKAQAAYDYGKEYYLIIAPTSQNDYSDPNYIVHKESGKYRFLNPLENLKAFSASMNAVPIKIYDKMNRSIE